MKIYPEEIDLLETCFACPEQYDALYKGKVVGYLRLRHGFFYATVPDVCGETVYESYPKGDGIFENDEREFYLLRAKEAIAAKLTEKHANDPSGPFAMGPGH